MWFNNIRKSRGGPITVKNSIPINKNKNNIKEEQQ